MGKLSTTKIPEPVVQDSREDERTSPFGDFNPFVQFRYSYRSVSTDGTKTHLSAREDRFENGRYESEEFSAVTDNSVYDQQVKEMEKYVKAQIEFCLSPFSFFLTKPKE